MPAPGVLAQVGRPAGGGGGAGTVKEQERKSLAEHYYQTGLKLFREMKYHDAATQLRQAVSADQQHVEAQLLLDQTLYILGERGAGFRDEMRRIRDETGIRIQLETSEVERLFAEGRLYMQRQEYARAAERFERCIETIRFFPYNIDKAGMRAQAEEALKQAREKEKDLQLRLKEERQRTAREGAALNEQQNIAYQHARVRRLLDQAGDAFLRTDFRLAIRLCQEVLELEPEHVQAQKLLEQARHSYRLKLLLDLTEARTEEMKRLIEGVYEATVPYQQVFMFPSDEEWAAVEKRSLDLQRLFETKGQSESAREQQIRLALEQSEVTFDFRGTPFSDALDFLRDVTGISYVVLKAAQEQLESNEPSITLKLSKIKLKNALELILAEAGGLVYRVRNDAVLINTADAEKEDLYLRFYEVSEIVTDRPDNPAPQLALTRPQDGGAGQSAGAVLNIGDEEVEVGGGIGYEKLIELIEGKLGEEEGEVDVQFMSGLLMVRGPLGAHRKIERLLDQLRRTTGIMVVIESKIIDIQDNFLEEIGIDFTGLPALIPNVLGNGVADLIGFNFTNDDQDLDIRAALINLFSSPLGSAAGTPFNLSSLGGGVFNYNYLDDFQLQAILDAVKRDQKARAIDASRINVHNGQRSHVLKVTQEAYISDIEVNQTGVTPTINPVIGVLNSGSILEARPIVSYDRKFVTLEIQPTLAVNGTPVFQRLQLIQGAGGVNTDITIELPVVSLSEIRTTVNVPDGGTIIVGGLKNFLKQDQLAGIPIVRHIPLLHNLFERKGHSDLKRSLIVLLTVEILITREQEASRFNKQGSVKLLD